MLNKKPTVHCRLDRHIDFIYVGSRVYVYPIDHPNHLDGHAVSNTTMAITSPVVSVDKKNRLFETQHTIYQIVD